MANGVLLVILDVDLRYWTIIVVHTLIQKLSKKIHIENDVKKIENYMQTKCHCQTLDIMFILQMVNIKAVELL
ncbi:hypothetical protein PIROE2DRAFT_5454 [Piromyces sp. E2]|nr:hypothetical protein PIROE2DRAFT_5454 [Piromyces sp. E2]|eukprot:OUM67186.1 hypothetical protein PIROE2DRAFT_5454 [Piromyces sp. E2]